MNNSAIYSATRYDGRFIPPNLYLYMGTGYDTVDMGNIRSFAKTKMDYLSDELNEMAEFVEIPGRFSSVPLKTEVKYSFNIDFRCYYKYAGIGLSYRYVAEQNMTESALSATYPDHFLAEYLLNGTELEGKVYFRWLLYGYRDRNLFINIGGGYGVFKSEIKFKYREKYPYTGNYYGRYTSETSFYNGILGLQYDLWPVAFSFDVHYRVGEFKKLTDDDGNIFYNYDNTIITLPLNPMCYYFGIGIFI